MVSKSNNMYFISNFNETEKGININNSSMWLEEGGRETLAVKFQHTTDKGWASKKPIYVDFAYTMSQDGVLEITDSVAAELIAQYNGVDPKSWSNPMAEIGRSSTIGLLAMCEYMHDPYDNSGTFAGTSLSKGANRS